MYTSDDLNVFLVKLTTSLRSALLLLSVKFVFNSSPVVGSFVYRIETVSSCPNNLYTQNGTCS